MTKRTLTLLDSGTVDLRTLDKVLQSVVFFADSIAIRASFEISAHDSHRSPEITRRIIELRERGLIALWAHEYEVDDSGRVRAVFGGGDSASRTADLVVNQTRLNESVTEMNEILRAMREEAYRRDPGRPYRQGVAEVVGLRNHLTSLVISSELRQDGLLTNPTARAVFAENLRPVEADSFQGSVVREVLAKLQIGSLRSLTTDQVDECRRASGGFRNLLDQSILAVARGVDPVITPASTAQELVGRYNEVVTRYAARRVGPEIANEVVWDVLGLTIPPSMYLKYGIKAFRWRKTADDLRPYLMLIQLERALGRHANRR